MKERVNVSVDEDLLDKARKSKLNVSGEFESALRKRLIVNNVDIPKALKCEICGTLGEKETADMVPPTTNTKDEVLDPTALTWLYPDEIWICNKCLRRKVRSISVAQ